MTIPEEFSRTPPHSIEAESSILGCLLLDNESWDVIADILSPDDFYRNEHREIFLAIAQLIAVNKAADVITVHEHLLSSKKAEQVGGMVYLNALSQYVPGTSNVRRYAEIVRERAILRGLAKAGNEIVTNSYDTAGRSVEIILDEAEAKILSIAEARAKGRTGFQSIDALVIENLDEIQRLADDPKAVTGTSTGFTDLDKLTSGLQDGDLVILAARPSMGKTSLAINIAENVALNDGSPVAVFSMEMGASQLSKRVLGSIGRINQSNLKSGNLSDDEWTRLSEAVEKLRTASIHIDETAGLTPSTLRAEARRLARKCGKLGLIVVDYVQLMSGSGVSTSENRATELGEISRGLKMLAKELQCPVIALSQLNRSVEQRTDKRPMMSDLRESGALEQDADVIMFIYRDDYYDKSSKEPNIAEIILAKQRNGPTGTVKLFFEKSQTRFENLATGSSEEY